MPSKPRKQQRRPPSKADVGDETQHTLRIVGGSLRGRRLEYHGERRTRPMKDRTREAIFNLVGPAVKGMHAIDLFAGTGAIGLEAISRGAAQATFIERHFPTARLIERNARSLGVVSQCEVIPSDTFFWASEQPPPPSPPWLVFCSPPYALYAERPEDMTRLLATLIAAAPAGSMFVVEADEGFDFGCLPAPSTWDVRGYPPAVVGVLRRQ